MEESNQSKRIVSGTCKTNDERAAKDFGSFVFGLVEDLVDIGTPLEDANFASNEICRHLLSPSKFIFENIQKQNWEKKITAGKKTGIKNMLIAAMEDGSKCDLIEPIGNAINAVYNVGQWDGLFQICINNIEKNSEDKLFTLTVSYKVLGHLASNLQATDLLWLIQSYKDEARVNVLLKGLKDIPRDMVPELDVENLKQSVLVTIKFLVMKMSTLVDKNPTQLGRFLQMVAMNVAINVATSNISQKSNEDTVLASLSLIGTILRMQKKFVRERVTTKIRWVELLRLLQPQFHQLGLEEIGMPRAATEIKNIYSIVDKTL